MRYAGRIPQDWAPDGVRLEVDWILNQDPEFGADGEWWTYLLLRPAADRLEYRLDLRAVVVWARIRPSAAYRCC